MMFESEIIIKKPVQTVFEFTTRFENNIRWQTGLVESVQTSPGPMRPGATYRCLNRFLGREIETQGVVTDYKPHQKCAYRIESGPIAGQSAFEFEPVVGGTRVVFSGDADLSGFSFAKMLMVPKIKKQIANDLAVLKKVLENHAV
jgi:uncharacterized membrane protein